MRVKTMLKVWLPLLVVMVALACGSDATPAAPEPVVIEKEVIKEVEVEKVVEVEKEVIKEVEVEKVVEVIKEVEAKMEKEPARSPLIGDIEGITVLTDFVPASYSEAPELAAMVAAGEIPPIEERVGTEPLVIRPIHEIGKYGGVWRRGFIGPNDTANAIRAVNHDRLLFWNPEGTEIVPHMAKGVEVSDDGKTTTIHLRKGHRWSDGAPFTADDFIFWYEDMYLNDDLNPVKRAELTVGGEQAVFKKVDETTVQIITKEPYYVLPTYLSSTSALSGHARWGRSALGGFAPAHYLKQFHPDYVQGGLDAVMQMAEAEDFDNWADFFKQKNSVFHNTELPALTAWILEKPITEPVWVMKRNPYSIWMDEAGNQLPYMNKVQMTLGEDLEVLNLRAIAGEFDQQARHMDLQKLPVMLENAEQGNYTVRLDPTRHGGDAMLCPNLNYDADPEIAKWLTNADFRRALSLGIDRDQINEGLFLGLGVPGSIAPGEDTIYSPGPESEWRTLWSTHDPELANQMLDGLGLTEKDSEGYRMRSDGQGRLIVEMQTYLSFMNFTELGEMVKEHWRDIGIDVDVRQLERSLAAQRRRANEHQFHVEVTWGAEDMYGHPIVFFPSGSSSCFGPKYGVWFQSNGEAGAEPPAQLARVFELYRKGMTLPDKARAEAGKELWRIVLDQVYGIGTVGQTPAIQGVRVVNNNLGNTAARHINSAAKDNPASSHPEQYYFKCLPERDGSCP
ncbi:MAG: ABC transporter substrate-binding protein [Dehalococcoidia bacterium]|nr:ABC transporter substrate-binding protein [Dehalococcoidia bacterium]